MSNLPTKEKSGPRIGCWLLGFLLLNTVFIGRLAWFWYLSEPNRQLQPGPRTTVIEGPLTTDGYVDYVAALNQRASYGVTPENNAVPLLIRAYGPQIIGDGYAPQYFELLGMQRPTVTGSLLISDTEFIQRSTPTEGFGDAFKDFDERAQTARRRPWMRTEFPDLAQLVDDNAAPLELITEASRRPRYYSPCVSPDEGSPMFAIRLDLEQKQREAGRQLTSRAMLRLGEGDTAGAWDDLLTCHRLARLTGESPFFIGALVSVAIDAMACEADQALIAGQTLTAEQARQCLQDVQALAPLPSLVETLDRTERWSLLDATIQVARHPKFIQDMGGSSASMPTITGAIDWNDALQVVNEEIDKAVAAMRLPDAKSRLAELDAVSQAPHGRSRRIVGMGLRSFMGNRHTASRDMGWSMLETFMPAIRQASIAETRAVARQRVLIVGFALAAFYADHNAYPESLADLVPSVVSELPLDPWSSQSLVYRRTSDGFVLYSVADDMQDNGGTPLDPQNGGALFDIVLRVGSE